MSNTSKEKDLDTLLKSAKWVDLSPLIENGIPRWPTHPPVIISQTMTHNHDGFYCQNLSMPEHTGAHVDAKSHMHSDSPELTIDKVPVNYLFGKCKIVHLEHLNLKPGDMADAAAISAWEKSSGEKIQEDDIVIVNFGWLKKHWRKDGEWAYYSTNQPGLTKDAADLFLERKIRVLGSDTTACGTPIIDGKSVLDEPKPHGCWIHTTVLGAGILLVECLANLEQLPDTCYFMAAPLKISRGSGSPLRAAALLFED